MISKLRVQQYPSASSFWRNSHRFLAQNECMNNLFWEVSKNWQTGKSVNWGGNIFRNGLVDLSALYLSTNYVLLSAGSTLGIEKLAKYGKAKKWKIVGITGPKDEVEQLATLWGGKTVLSKLRKRFIIFESAGSNSQTLLSEGLNLVKATELEWPRIRLWAGEFATESNPPLDPQATILMAKSMLRKKNLYLLKKAQKTVAMAGFGRETDQKVVINMVYVPTELRRRQFGSILVSSLFKEAMQRGFSNALMFSDHLQKANLYEALGCINRGEFYEIKFEL